MRNDGVSMILEYIILTAIIALFVLLLSLNLDSVLRESQLSRVVENQFSDVSAQISSQIVDMIAVYPKNGNLSSRVFMPQKVGEIEYIVMLENNRIKIVSDDGRFSKFLSLGAISDLELADLIGLTHSLNESHTLLYQKISCIYPTAVLNLNRTSLMIPGAVELDVSSSSPGSAQIFEWAITLWNGSFTGWKRSSDTMSLTVYVDAWSDSWANCYYNASKDWALCKIILEVKIFCEGQYLNSSTIKQIFISKSGAYGNITVDKFVVPSQVEVGQIAYLHISLDTFGISAGKVVNLTSVLSLDSSSSMGDLSLIGGNVTKILELSTLFKRLPLTVKKGGGYVVNVNLSSDLSKYSFIVAEIPQGYNFEVSKIGNINCPSKDKCWCDSSKKLCYVTNVTPGNLTIEVVNRSESSRSSQLEVLVYLAKIDSLKLSAVEYLGKLRDGDFAGLVEYDTHATVKQVNTSIYLRNLTTNKSVVISEVKKMRADGYTNIYHALWKANQTLHENTTITRGTIPLIILMTGGLPTVKAHVNQSDCPNNWFIMDGIGFCKYGTECRDCYVQIEQLAEKIKQTMIDEHEIRICTIGFGREGEYNATLLNNVASYINGTTKCAFNASTHEQLQNAFRTIRSYFEVVATNVTITDVLPSYVLIEDDVEIRTKGAPVCESGANIRRDEENRTIVQFKCSQLRLGDKLELIIPIKFEQTGTFVLNVPQISNVTYVDIYNKIVTIPLEIVSVRYGSPGTAVVRIE